MTKSSNNATNQAVTRAALIEKLFAGIDTPDAELDLTINAMGLDPKVKKFKAETAYSIAVCRSWIDGGEIKDYDALAKAWNERKDSVIAEYKNSESALTTQSKNGLQVSEQVDEQTDNNPAHILAKPAQQNFEAGRQLIESSAERILHNQRLTAQVLDAAFFEGVKEGMEQLGEAKKFEPPPLLTQEQAAGIVQKIVRDSQQSRDSKSE